MRVFYEGVEVPPPLAADLAAFERELGGGGLASALRFLNRRTPHRFTAAYRFDGSWLRNLALVDKWAPDVARGDDVPLAKAYCSIVHERGEPLEILDSSTDERFPHLAGGQVACYCGVMLRDERGEPFGALCHFDYSPCQTKTSDMPLLVAAAAAIYASLAAQAG